RPRPARAETHGTAPVEAQPPPSVPTQATAGGPANWPAADGCCIQPIEVEVVSVVGASLTTSKKSVVGMSPPTVENTNIIRNCTGTGMCRPNATKAVAAIVT